MKVSDVLKLPSLLGAEVLAGRGGLSNPVESVTVLEYTEVDELQERLFHGNEFTGNELLITAFAASRDDVEAQCMNIRRFHSVGAVGVLLYYVGLIMPEVSPKLIELCDELDFVLICMPRDNVSQRYGDAISDILFAVFREQERKRFFVSTLLDRLSGLRPQQRSMETLLRMLSEHLRASVMLLGPNSRVEFIAAWPRSLTENLREQAPRWLDALGGGDELVVPLADGSAHLQRCPTLIDASDGLRLLLLRYGEPFTGDMLWQASECVRLFIHIWDRDYGKFAASELVRAIINDEPLQKNHLARLFRIDVGKLDQMWLLIPREAGAGHSERLLELCTRRLSELGQPLLTGYYEETLAAFTNSANTRGRQADLELWTQEEDGAVLEKYELVRIDRLSDTTAARRAYYLAHEQRRNARRIYPEAAILRQEELSFAKACADIASKKEELEEYTQMLALLKRSGSELLPTLTCYMLDSASNMAETARKLYVHLNTVKYRLKQIHELTGYSPTQMPGAYILCIAAAISRLRS